MTLIHGILLDKIFWQIERTFAYGLIVPGVDALWPVRCAMPRKRCGAGSAPFAASQAVKSASIERFDAWGCAGEAFSADFAATAGASVWLGGRLQPEKDFSLRSK
ncbi:MAG TPA: hypothetical protein VFQ89_12510 [Candidatus Binatia bacterium]|nr:hypothetical protein [Candidatus Binatia bacterium]